jgi:hypothetical protein
MAEGGDRSSDWKLLNTRRKGKGIDVRKWHRAARERGAGWMVDFRRVGDFRMQGWWRCNTCTGALAVECRLGIRRTGGCSDRAPF